MKKPNKIIVCLSNNEEERLQMVARLLVNFGFARTNGDAKKIISFTPFDIELSGAYFIASKTFNFRTSSNTTQRLFEMALRGNLVLVGAKKIPSEMEFMCEIHTISDFN